MTRATGYSIVELLVATLVTLGAMAAAIPMLNGMQGGFATEADRADLSQRLRIAQEALARRLRQAGGGAQQGSRAGPLGYFTAAVFPFRQGAQGADPAGTFRPDTLTVVSAASATAAQTTIRQPLAGLSGSAFLNLDAGCPPGDPVCGFAPGMDVMVYDDTGSYDTFRVTAAAGGVLQLQHTTLDTAQIYQPGATIVEAAIDSYYLKTDAATDTYTLLHYDGVGSDVAIADHVFGLAFEYFGEPTPPTLVKPVTDPIGPWTTYGPKPPPVASRTTGYEAGENCAFQVDANAQQIPRLAALDAGTTLVRLSAGLLTDGPWCPDSANPHRYDADLLRIRKIGITLRVEAASAALRGPAGLLFTRAGSSRTPSRWLPDQELRFEIAPLNLSLGR